MLFSKSPAVLAALALTGAVLASGLQTHKYSYAFVTKDGKDVMENWDGGQDQSKMHAPGPDRIYVKKDGKLFVITDAASIAKFKKAMEPVLKIAAKQTALGEQQSKIGEAQSKIGEKQSKLGEEMGKIGEQMGQQPSQDEMGKLQARMNALQKQMDQLNDQMSEPSKKQDELGRKQDALGKQQDKASAEAEIKIDSIIDDAFARGLAKPN